MFVIQIDIVGLSDCDVKQKPVVSWKIYSECQEYGMVCRKGIYRQTHLGQE